MLNLVSDLLKGVKDYECMKINIQFEYKTISPPSVDQFTDYFFIQRGNILTSEHKSNTNSQPCTLSLDVMGQNFIYLIKKRKHIVENWSCEKQKFKKAMTTVLVQLTEWQ